MKIKQLTILLFTVLNFTSGLPPKLQKKVDKVIKSTYEIEDFSFNAITISPKVAKELPSKFGNDNLFKIESQNMDHGYAYVAKAPSKTAQYDYLVLINPELSVVKAKVLIYREEYGGEIGSKRWLKQFIGKTQNDQFRYGDNIDAIAGATISVRSMTNAMNDLMQSLKILNAKGIL
ncbi:FMN-binding protein [Winogradskyella immobilis]|uniref:FMN-binding protein n=1 Tax=Winogradskyella immobilis TaxID=2816852 RepID=A0ABS8ER79_9FLAO|nr:FMN-binding protein [Winogradskyella immobilis]MCC1485045.1 FMN-binding protein [Winogradskyella immobilis]MCG0017137.1 FMN-binding protein [Winogradskyella immobilis]